MKDFSIVSGALRALWLSVLLLGCTPEDPAGPAGPESVPPELVQAVRAAAYPLTGEAGDYNPLLELVGDARVVLLGEATHGTHEFYRERARITRRLIEEQGFTAVAVEADWPDAYRVNRYVRGVSEDANATQALSGFKRFPTWMWPNRDVLEFVEWLRQRNQSLPPGVRVGFYGLDVYSLFPSIDAVLAYLDRIDPAAAQRARDRYGCFGRFRDDPQAYSQAVESGSTPSCQAAAAEQLQELEGRAAEFTDRGGANAGEEFFDALQNARLIVGAEEYFRSLYLRGVSTWNLRDRYMIETLAALTQHLEANGQPAKVVVWAHNSHVGDARATHMGDQGEWNIGQLARERWGRDAVLVGFTTYRGTVLAASDWGGPAQRKTVRPALAGSYEDVFHQAEIPSFLLVLRGGPAAEGLREPRLERAIGVIYLPQSERISHYFHARLPEQFDAVIHWDETRAVEPLRR